MVDRSHVFTLTDLSSPPTQIEVVKASDYDALAAQLAEVTRDLESGFMQGAYARLKRLQDKERRLAEAEYAIESAGKCLVMSNNGPREALEVLRRYKATADSAVQSTGEQK